MSCSSNNNINQTFIIEPVTITGSCAPVNTTIISGCSDDTVIKLTNSIEPEVDNKITLGSNIKRFREINTKSGKSTTWESSESITTPKVVLGLDSNGEHREITANNSIINNDTLIGGSY